MTDRESITGLARRYPRIIRWSDEDNCYIGTLPDLCGDCTDALTACEVADNPDEIAEELVTHYIESGEELPEPKNTLVTAEEFTKGDIAAAIRRLRDFRGLTRKELASLLGCSLSTLIKWENGLRRPGGAAARLLSILYRHPELVHGTELTTE